MYNPEHHDHAALSEETPAEVKGSPHRQKTGTQCVLPLFLPAAILVSSGKSVFRRDEKMSYENMKKLPVATYPAWLWATGR
jgi:hypothetical protein